METQIIAVKSNTYKGFRHINWICVACGKVLVDVKSEDVHLRQVQDKGNLMLESTGFLSVPVVPLKDRYCNKCGGRY